MVMTATVSKMSTHFTHVKSMTPARDWRGDIEEFVALTLGWVQEEVAALDPDLDQNDLSRWRKGKYEREPSAPKMAAVRRVIRVMKDGPGPYEKGLLDAADEMEKRVADLRLRALATRPSNGRAELGERGQRELGKAHEAKKKAGRRTKEA